ncbi:MAG: DUF3800 domain-containing protein [Planctomycetota bacterium]|jgi:hypothetical protein
MTKKDTQLYHKKRYRIYIDESGDHTYRSFESPGKRYFGVTGCIIDLGYYEASFRPKLQALKQENFPRDPDDPPVILHREEILRSKGCFWRLRDPDNRIVFNQAILQFFAEQEYVVVTVVIDKKTHIKRYGQAAFHPYHFCLAAMLERYCGFLNFYSAEGDVMIETRNKRENCELQTAYDALLASGTFYHPPKFFSRVLTSKKIKFRTKNANIAGLQIADLLAHPCKNEILIEHGRINEIGQFSEQIKGIIQDKYNKQMYQGRIKGYGKVFIK